MVHCASVTNSLSQVGRLDHEALLAPKGPRENQGALTLIMPQDLRDIRDSLEQKVSGVSPDHQVNHTVTLATENSSSISLLYTFT